MVTAGSQQPLVLILGQIARLAPLPLRWNQTAGCVVIDRALPVQELEKGLDGTGLPLAGAGFISAAIHLSLIIFQVFEAYLGQVDSPPVPR